MKKKQWFVQTSVACLTGLIILNVVMLASLLAGVNPHPPVQLGPLGGTGPFISANVALSTVGALFCWWEYQIGYVLAIVSVILNSITFGPQKYFSETANLIFPAVTTGTMFAVVLLIAAIIGIRRKAR